MGTYVPTRSHPRRPRQRYDGQGEYNSRAAGRSVPNVSGRLTCMNPTGPAAPRIKASAWQSRGDVQRRSTATPPIGATRPIIGMSVGALGYPWFHSRPEGEPGEPIPPWPAPVCPRPPNP